MPGRIEQLEKTVHDRHAALAERSFHRQGRDKIAGGKIRLADLERDLAAACLRRHVLEERGGGLNFLVACRHPSTARRHHVKRRVG